MGGTKGLWKLLKSFGKRSASYECISEADGASPSEKETKMGSGSTPPDDVPPGHLAVYASNKRYVISTEYLRHNLFKALLEKTEQEFGFQHKGALPVACEPDLFEYLLWLIGTNSPAAETTRLDDLINSYSGSAH